jgi:hypothetical protein
VHAAYAGDGLDGLFEVLEGVRDAGLLYPLDSIEDFLGGADAFWDLRVVSGCFGEQIDNVPCLR